MTPTDMSLEILNFIETKKNFFVGSSNAAASTELYGLTYRVKLRVWLYTLPGPILGAEITSASLLREPKSENNVQPIRGRCAKCGYEVNCTLVPGYGSISHR
jgi:hypothetical protein